MALSLPPLCTRPRDAQQEFARATAVFSGHVISQDRMRVMFAVHKVWKGDVGRAVTLLTGLPADLNVWVEDVYEFTTGKEYLVYALAVPGGLHTSVCQRTRPLSTADADMRALDQIAPEARVLRDPGRRIPSIWIDLPEAPFIAREVSGKAVLINRSERTFRSIRVGCVSERNGTVMVKSGYFSLDVSGGGIGPRSELDNVFGMVDRMEWYIANEHVFMPPEVATKGCDDPDRVAVTDASGEDYAWSAQGTRWPR